MPYDNVYSEKRTPGVLRTVWRKFYGDTTAMIGLYGCGGLALLCIFGSWFAPYGLDQQFLGTFQHALPDFLCVLFHLIFPPDSCELNMFNSFVYNNIIRKRFSSVKRKSPSRSRLA